MKTLQAFWHWVENEKPDQNVLWPKAQEALSPVARQAFYDAVDYVKHRVSADCLGQDALLQHTEAVRELSIELCRSLEKMHEFVPEAAEPSVVFFDMSKLPGGWGTPTGILIAGTPAERIGPEHYAALPDLMTRQNAAQMARNDERDRMASMYDTLTLKDVDPSLKLPPMTPERAQELDRMMKASLEAEGKRLERLAFVTPTAWDDRRALLDEYIEKDVVSLSDPECAAVYEEVMRQCDALPKIEPAPFHPQLIELYDLERKQFEAAYGTVPSAMQRGVAVCTECRCRQRAGNDHLCSECDVFGKDSRLSQTEREGVLRRAVEMGAITPETYTELMKRGD